MRIKNIHILVSLTDLYLVGDLDADSDDKNIF